MIAPALHAGAWVVKRHGFSLLRRSSLGYEGRAAVVPLVIFDGTRRSMSSFAKASKDTRPHSSRLHSRGFLRRRVNYFLMPSRSKTALYRLTSIRCR
jgi:hypothetical protein